MRMPDLRQNRAVISRRGETQPRRPASTMMAGSKVTAARNATPMAIANAGPMVANNSKLANVIPRNVTPTVAADAAMTLPIELNALLTA